jgi:hypothetical protein
MLITDLVVEFREQVKDKEQPYLWSSDEVLGYLIDAQDLFCRLTGGIPDATTRALTDLPLTVDAPFTAFSPYILRIRSARLVTAKTSVRLVQEGDFATISTSDYGTSTLAALDDTDTGTVEAGILGLEEHKIRWYKVPSTADTCRLQIFRLPYPRIADENSSLEIDEQHHRALIMRMKELAYDKQDAETYDKGARDKYKAEFEAYCARAKVERQRIAYRPRTVAYGGV